MKSDSLVLVDNLVDKALALPHDLGYTRFRDHHHHVYRHEEARKLREAASSPLFLHVFAYFFLSQSLCSCI